MRKLRGAVEERVDALIETCSGWQPEPLHEAEERSKVKALAADMLERGWQGPPVVVDGDLAVTGSHRLAARARAWNEGVDVALPVVELSEVCAEFGADWDAHRGDELDWYEAVRTIDVKLPREVVAYLGLDAH